RGTSAEPSGGPGSDNPGRWYRPVWAIAIFQGPKGSGGRRLIVVCDRTLSERAIDLRQKLAAHLVARRLVEPVEKPPAAGRLAEPLIDFVTNLGEVLLHLGHRLEGLALPAAVADPARCFDRPILHALQRRRRRGRALRQ